VNTTWPASIQGPIHERQSSSAANWLQVWRRRVGSFSSLPNSLLIWKHSSFDPIVAALEPLRSKGYLTTVKDGTYTQSFVTAVGTGNTPLPRVIASNPRDLFFDADITSIADSPPADGLMWSKEIAPLASADFQAAVGFFNWVRFNLLAINFACWRCRYSLLPKLELLRVIRTRNSRNISAMLTSLTASSLDSLVLRIKIPWILLSLRMALIGLMPMTCSMRKTYLLRMGSRCYVRSCFTCCNCLVSINSMLHDSSMSTE